MKKKKVRASQAMASFPCPVTEADSKGGTKPKAMALSGPTRPALDRSAFPHWCCALACPVRKFCKVQNDPGTL